jgi:hypothetical protein
MADPTDFSSTQDYLDFIGAGDFVSIPTGGSSGGILNQLLGNLGGVNLGGLLGSITAGAGYNQMLNDLRSFGQTAKTGAETIGQTASEATKFVPFTVTSGTGANIGTTPEGGTMLSLSPAERALQQQGLTGAGQFFGSAMGAEDPRIAAQQQALGTMFLQQANQQPVPTQLSQLTGQAYQQGQQRIGQAMQPADINLLRGQFAGQVGNYLGQQPPVGITQLGQQALGMGTQGLQGVTAPSDIEALRSQYAGLAGQAAGGLLTDPMQREADIYNRIRAAQTPEEQRQRLALEERLAAQGRLGTSSAAYGGATPEQLALETAQAEARNRASLAAMEQARAEQQQQLATAQTLGGMTGQFAGISSDLQSAAQQRASQLAQLGLSAEQIQSQLQSEGLGRAAQAGGLASDLATSASGLESQALQRGLSLAGLGMQGTEMGQGLTTQQLNNLLALQQSNIGASQAQQALRSGNLALGQGLLTSAYAPQSALLNVLQQGLGTAGLADVARRQAAQTQAEAEMAGLDAQLQTALARGNLTAEGMAALAAALGGTQQAATGGLFSGIDLGDVWSDIKGIFS